MSLHYYLLCFDLRTGKELWKKEYHAGKPPGGMHRKNSFASETPVSDGETVGLYPCAQDTLSYTSARQLWTVDDDADSTFTLTAFPEFAMEYNGWMGFRMTEAEGDSREHFTRVFA